MKTSINLVIDHEAIQNVRDDFLAAYWHAAQANQTPYGDQDACRLADLIGREIIRRFLASTPPLLWEHQGSHAVDRRAQQKATTDDQAA